MSSEGLKEIVIEALYFYGHIFRYGSIIYLESIKLLQGQRTVL